jgi:transposase
LIAATSDNRIIAMGCWGHARRKFEPLIEAGPHPQAAWILDEIRKLYDVEDRARGMTDDERLALRQAESWPIAARIKVWLDAWDPNELPKSPLRAGINYLRNRSQSLETLLAMGSLQAISERRPYLDRVNNRTEAVTKGPVMGKRAWLFFNQPPRC